MSTTPATAAPADRTTRPGGPAEPRRRHHAPRPPPDDRARWRAPLCCAGMLMTILDQTTWNVALPSIQDDLGFSRSGLAGRERLHGRLRRAVARRPPRRPRGRRNVLVAGLVVFTGRR